MLDNVIYVDILNEYPHWHGYDWLKQELNIRADMEQFKLDNPDANLPDLDATSTGANPLQKAFFNQFANDILSKLKQKYPALDFFASTDSGTSEKDLDLTNFDALDYHIWFNHWGNNPGMSDIRTRYQGNDYRASLKELKTFWTESKESLGDNDTGSVKATCSCYPADTYS